MRRLRWCLIILPALLVAPPTTSAEPPLPPPAPAPEAKFLSVFTNNPYERDRPLLATVSPNGDGYRDLAYVRFYLTASARVNVRAQATQRSFQRVTQPRWSVTRRMEKGWQTVVWRPSPDLDPTTYAIMITVEAGRQAIRYGRLTQNSDSPPGPVVRVLAVDAAFDRSSYAAGERSSRSRATPLGSPCGSSTWPHQTRSPV